MEEISKDTPEALLGNAVAPPVLLMAQRPVFYRKTSTFRQKSASKNLFRLCEEGLEITNLVHLYFLLYVCTKVI